MKNGFRFFVIALAAVTGLGLAACKNDPGGGGDNNWPAEYQNTIWNYKGTTERFDMPVKLEFGTNTVKTTFNDSNNTIQTWTSNGETEWTTMEGYRMFYLYDKEGFHTDLYVFLKPDGTGVRVHSDEDGPWVKE
jgi:hypothetical protein